MNLPKFPAWMVTGTLLLLAVTMGRGETGTPGLPEQLDRARADKDNDSVVEICRRELEKSPGDTNLLRELCRLQIEQKDYPRAAATLDRLDKASADPALRNELRGDLAQAEGKTPDEAVAAWRRALTIKSADAPTLEGKIADALDQAGRWTEAAEALRAFLKAKPEHAARTMQLATCLLNSGHPEDADKQAVAAGTIDAADDTVKAAAPAFDRLRPQLPALHKLGERIADEKPGAGPDPRVDRALIYYRAGAFHAALEDARQAAAKDDADGRNVAARLVEGQCLWRLDRGPEAVALQVAKIEDAHWFDDARRCERLRAPDELTGAEAPAVVVRAYAARAMALIAGNQPALALEDAEKAIRTEEKAGRRTADTEVVLAAALLRNDRPAEALAAARRATEDDPRNPDGWALCGRLAQEAADFPGAVENLTHALGIREEGAWLRRRETCLRTLGRNAEADRDARRVAQLPASS